MQREMFRVSSLGQGYRLSSGFRASSVEVLFPKFMNQWCTEPSALKPQTRNS